MSAAQQGRRGMLGGFLGLVGGATVAGTVARQASATAPTLILPPALVPLPPPTLATIDKAEMDAFIRVKAMVPDDYFRHWLERGLRNADMFQGRDEATVERILLQGGMQAARRPLGVVAC